jgi:hypothetical protein
MRNRVRISLLALLVCTAGAIVAFDVGNVSGRQAPAVQAGIGPADHGAVPLSTCSDACEAGYQTCFAMTQGDPELQALCLMQRNDCIALCPTGTETTTHIGLDKPDPSQPGQPVTVHVAIVGADDPTGTVTITGADVNCTCTLNPAALAHCTVVFNTAGTYTLTATYSGDGTHNGSSDTETHTVQQ